MTGFEPATLTLARGCANSCATSAFHRSTGRSGRPGTRRRGVRKPYRTPETAATPGCHSAVASLSSGQIVGDEVGERVIDVDPQVLVAREHHVVGAVEEVGQLL